MVDEILDTVTRQLMAIMKGDFVHCFKKWDGISVRSPKGCTLKRTKGPSVLRKLFLLKYYIAGYFFGQTLYEQPQIIMRHPKP